MNCNQDKTGALSRLHRYVPQRCTFACRTGTPARRQKPRSSPGRGFSARASDAPRLVKFPPAVEECVTTTPWVRRQGQSSASIASSSRLWRRRLAAISGAVLSLFGRDRCGFGSLIVGQIGNIARWLQVGMFSSISMAASGGEASVRALVTGNSGHLCEALVRTFSQHSPRGRRSRHP